MGPHANPVEPHSRTGVVASQVRTLKEQLSLKEKKLRQLQDSLTALKDEFVRVRRFATGRASVGCVCSVHGGPSCAQPGPFLSSAASFSAYWLVRRRKTLRLRVPTKLPFPLR